MSVVQTYWITLSDGRSFRRHVDHIRARSIPDADSPTPNWFDFPNTPESTASRTAEPIPLRRSTRVVTAPDRYEPTN